jgi:dipeptidyl aminopeptidase/acylaminoacyl peptidase
VNLKYLWLSTGILICGGVSTAADRRPVTAEDCVRVKRILYGEAKLSRNGAFVAYIVETPNVDNNTNDYQVWMRTATDRVESRNGRMLYHSTDLLSGLTWLKDGKRIAIAANTGKTHSKVLLINIDTGQYETVLDVVGGMGTYSINQEGGVIAYTTNSQASISTIAPNVIEHGYSVRHASSERVEQGRVAIHVQSRLSNGQWRDVVIPNSLGRLPGFENVQTLSLSPDGRYLVFSFVLDTVPKNWERSRTVQRWESFGLKPVASGLCDLSTREVRLALDSPNVSEPPAQWSDDSRGFLILAAPPVGSVWEKEYESNGLNAWAKGLFAVYIDTPNVPEVSEVLSAPASQKNAAIVRWKEFTGDLLVAIDDVNLVQSRLSGRKWKELNRTALPLRGEISFAQTVDGKVFVGIEEQTNIPSDLVRYDASTKAVSLLTELNPQTRELALSEAERIDWSNRFGSKTNGYLIKPINYVAGLSYPLVITTHNAVRSSFTCDTDARTAFPPQPLASAGFLIFEIDVLDDKVPKELKGETQAIAEVDNWMASVESGIDLLVARGIIDRNNVGIIGWSRTGWYVDFMATHSDFRFRAISSADDGTYDYGSYWLNQWAPGSEIEAAYGGPPYGATLQNWLHYAPAFNAATVRSPILMEYMGYGLLPEPYHGYEFFTALDRLGKPVDLFFYPKGEHRLDTPFERVASLQRNVDWFRFWMQGYEGSPPPYDPDQYLRWHKLRAQQEWNERMEAQGKNPSAEFLRRRGPGTFLQNTEAAPDSLDRAH